MKPSWSDAPEWAKYLAMDKDGWWWWHELEPKITFVEEWISEGRFKQCKDNIHWLDTLEPRPLDSST